MLEKKSLARYKRNRGEYYITLPKDLIDLLDLGYEKEVKSQDLLDALESTYEEYKKAEEDYRYSDAYNSRFDEKFYTDKLNFLLKLLFKKIRESTNVEDIGEIGYVIERVSLGDGYAANWTDEFNPEVRNTIKMKALYYSRCAFNNFGDKRTKIRGIGKTEKEALCDLAEELKRFKVTGILKKSRYM